MSRRAWLAALPLVLAACTGGDDADPSPTTQPSTSTSAVDLTGVALPGVDGETTTTIDDKGEAVLVGTVTSPTGPLAGATVSIDRIVAGREVHHDVVTAADGRWELRDVPGGRYRVRAYLAPVYAQTTAEVRFLADGDEHRFDLVVDDQRGVVVRADVAPDQPLLDGDVNLVVLVVQRTVAEDGVVRSTPLSGIEVELTGLGRWSLRDDSQDGDDGGSTDLLDTTTTTFDPGPSPFAVLSEGGRARYELRCLAPGAPGLSLRVPVVVAATPESAPPGASTTSSTEPRQSVEEVPLELPACIDPSATTTTTSPSTTTP